MSEQLTTPLQISLFQDDNEEPVVSKLSIFGETNVKNILHQNNITQSWRILLKNHINII